MAAPQLYMGVLPLMLSLLSQVLPPSFHSMVLQDNPTSFPFPSLSLFDHYCLLGGFELDQRSSDHVFKPGTL